MKFMTFGEIMLRLKSPGQECLFQSPMLEATFGGGEANVAVSLANYGRDVSYLTVLPDNAVAAACKGELRRFGVDTSRIVTGPGRVGIYYLESGANQRPSKVVYDRAYSAIALAKPGDIDWDKAFAGVDWFHITGITPAISQSAMELSLESVKQAKARSITVSCDLNYRKNLWTPEEAQQVMPALVEYCDVIIGTVEDSALTVGVVPETADLDLGRQTEENYFKTAQMLAKRFNAKKVAMMERESISSNDCNWFMKLYDAATDTMAHSREYAVRIVDNVGCGDAFGAGLIHALRAGMSDQEAVDFGTAAGALKHTINGDYNLTSRDEVLNIMNSDSTGRVQR